MNPILSLLMDIYVGNVMLFHWSRFGKHLRHRSFKIKVGSIDDNKNKKSWWTHGAFLLEDMGPYWVTWIGPLYGIQNFKRIKRFKPHRRSDLAKLLNPFLYDELSLNQMSKCQQNYSILWKQQLFSEFYHELSYL